MIDYTDKLNDGVNFSLLLLFLVLMDGFGCIFLNTPILKYIYSIILVVFLFLSNKNERTKCRLVIAYFSFIVVSCIYSSIVHGQDFIRVFVNSCQYFSLIIIFLLFKMNGSLISSEKTLIVLCIFFCICYIIQYLVYPIAIFNGALDKNAIDNYGQFRMRMPGSLCGYLLYFYGVNEYIQKRKNKYILYVLLGFFPILMMGFRSLMALTILFTIFMIPFVTRRVSKSVKWLFVAVIVGCISFNIPLVSEKYDEMMERQKSSQTFDNDDYIRLLALDYFSNQVFIHPGERICGGGVPLNDTKYGKSVMGVAETDGYWWVDLGIVGLSFILGMPAVICLVLVVLKCVFLSSPPDKQYIRFALLTVLLGSVMTSMELFRNGNILVLGLVYYLLINENESRNINFSQSL